MSFLDHFASAAQRQEAMDAAYVARRDHGDRAEEHLLHKLERSPSRRRQQVYRLAIRMLKER